MERKLHNGALQGLLVVLCLVQDCVNMRGKRNIAPLEEEKRSHPWLRGRGACRGKPFVSYSIARDHIRRFLRLGGDP